MSFRKTSSADEPEAPPPEAPRVETAPAPVPLPPVRKGAPSLYPLFTPKSHLEGTIALFNALKAQDQATDPFAMREQIRFVKGYEGWYADVAHWDEDDARVEEAMREMFRRRDHMDTLDYKVWLRSRIEMVLYRRRLSFGRREVVAWGSYVNELAFHAYYSEDTVRAALPKDAHGTPNFLEIAGRLVAHNRKEFGTTTIVVDAARDAEGGFGQTGVGKSRLGLRLCSSLAPPERPFHVIRDLVYKFDTEAFGRLLFQDHREFRAAQVDEAEKFLERRRSTSTGVMNAGHQLMAKRSLRQYDVFVLPSIWILDERLIFGLIQMRWHVTKKGEVEVYVNNGQGSRAEDTWGYRLSTLGIPDVPATIGKIYDRTKAAVGRWDTLSNALAQDAGLARITADLDRMLARRVASLSKSGPVPSDPFLSSEDPVAGPDGTEVPQEPVKP
jgi:hypothetical protein